MISPHPHIAVVLFSSRYEVSHHDPLVLVVHMAGYRCSLELRRIDTLRQRIHWWNLTDLSKV